MDYYYLSDTDSETNGHSELLPDSLAAEKGSAESSTTQRQNHMDLSSTSDDFDYLPISIDSETSSEPPNKRLDENEEREYSDDENSVEELPRDLERLINMTKELKIESQKKNKELYQMYMETTAQAYAMKKLQEECDHLKEQLNEKADLADKMQVERDNIVKKFQTQIDQDGQLASKYDDEFGTLIKTSVDRAWECRYQEKYEEAIDHWNDAIGLEISLQNRPSELMTFYANKSYCHLQLGQYKQAINAADSVLVHDASDIFALENCAWANLRLNNYSAARADFEILATLNPSNFEIRNGSITWQDDVIVSAWNY